MWIEASDRDVAELMDDVFQCHGEDGTIGKGDGDVGASHPAPQELSHSARLGAA